MQSKWSDAEAARVVADYVARGVNPDLAIRTYSSRLLGSDPRLVMHGGGNTSVKTTMRDVYGDTVAVICIKGSGRELGSIEPSGHPAVRLEPLHRLRPMARISDEDMVNVQRQNLIDTAAPNPSVETLLHAYLPHKFVDHTHSITSTAIASLVDNEAACRRVFGGRVGFVPYVMPGYGLGRAAAEAYERDSSVRGLLLGNHGIFSFADTARDAYELMIEFVTLAERAIAEHGRVGDAFTPAVQPQPIPDLLRPTLRGALAEVAAEIGAPTHWLLDLRTSERILRFVCGRDLADYAIRGMATPEHVIRIKMTPAIVSTSRDQMVAAVRAYVGEYRGYFERNNARVGGGKTMLDPLPRVLLLPGIGVVGVGKSAAEAAISADVAEAWIEAIEDAEAIGTYRSISEADHFDMEYWSLEQAKLGRGAEKRLARRVCVVTGGAGAIGAATARAFAAEGAEVVTLDIAPNAGAIACDVTDAASVEAAFAAVARRYGGVDIVVSNAGAAWPGAMADMDDAALRRSFELNFFAHQNVAQAAVRVMRAQAMGGVILFNVSKQAINPGPNFGSYGTSKAALLALLRQYALEHAGDGIRVNGVNADRIRSGLLTPAMIATRAAARGVTEHAYMAGNLLGREVTADDVAAAFVASALMPATTGNIIPVDGGNVAAMLR